MEMGTVTLDWCFGVLYVLMRYLKYMDRLIHISINPSSIITLIKPDCNFFTRSSLICLSDSLV